MRCLTVVFTTLIASPVFAKSFDRPIPQAQSATAELWFALGSIAMIAALVLVQRLVARK
ncbi:hypothetical protein ACSSVY_000088 [Roseovarius sp. MBR-51]